MAPRQETGSVEARGQSIWPRAGVAATQPTRRSLILLDQRVQTLGDQAMAGGVGVRVPLGHPQRVPVAAPIDVRQVEHDKPRASSQIDLLGVMSLEYCMSDTIGRKMYPARYSGAGCPRQGAGRATTASGRQRRQALGDHPFGHLRVDACLLHECRQFVVRQRAFLPDRLRDEPHDAVGIVRDAPHTGWHSAGTGTTFEFSTSI